MYSGPARWVRLGEHDKSSTDDEADPKDFEIVERITHPDYVKLYNDIALFRLKTDVSFDEYMRPACLQTKHQFSKTYAIATGWGTTEGGQSQSRSGTFSSNFLMKRDVNAIATGWQVHTDTENRDIHRFLFSSFMKTLKYHPRILKS